MSRNFFRRIEVVFPIEDGNLRERCISEVLGFVLQDNVKAHFLQSDGSYKRVQPKRGERPVRCQMKFIARSQAAAEAERSFPSDGKIPKVQLAPNPFK
jgi:polyphosphate kinase